MCLGAPFCAGRLTNSLARRRRRRLPQAPGGPALQRAEVLRPTARRAPSTPHLPAPRAAAPTRAKPRPPLPLPTAASTVPSPPGVPASATAHAAPRPARASRSACRRSLSAVARCVEWCIADGRVGLTPHFRLDSPSTSSSRAALRPPSLQRMRATCESTRSR
jgi:hypothetical protein